MKVERTSSPPVTRILPAAGLPSASTQLVLQLAVPSLFEYVAAVNVVLKGLRSRWWLGGPPRVFPAPPPRLCAVRCLRKVCPLGLVSRWWSRPPPPSPRKPDRKRHVH